VNSCVNSPEDGPVGPKHVEIRQYINKIETVTSIGFYSIYFPYLHFGMAFMKIICGQIETGINGIYIYQISPTCR